MDKKQSQKSKLDQSKSGAAALIESSKLFYESGDLAGATASAQSALAMAPEEVGVLTHASWLFSLLNYEDKAISVFRKLSTIIPLTAGQSCQLSGILSRNGYISEAADFALAATKKEPGNEFYIQHYASILNLAGRAHEAATILTNALHSHNPNANILRQLSASCILLDEPEKALNFAMLANTVEPDNVDMAIHYGNLLMKSEQHQAAAEFFSKCLLRGVHHDFIFILLSAALAHTGDNQGALEAIDRGIAVQGSNPELLMQKGSVLCALERFADAVEIYKRVIAKKPDFMPARQACLAALTVSGQFEEAIALCAGMMSEAPGSKTLARSLQYLLGQQLSSEKAQTTIDPNKFSLLRKQQSGIRVPRKKSGLLAIHYRIISALVMREARTRFSHSKLGYAWVVFEPLAHIALMIILINTFAHGSPPLGQSFAIFYFTGIIPYHLFTHTSSYLMSAVSGNKALLQMPTVTPFDVTLARAIVELATESFVALLLIVGFNLFGFEANPINSLGVVWAFLILWVAGFGMGMINSVLSMTFNGWEKIWGAAIAVLYFASGTFYIPRMMPEWARDILVWNPVLQGIEMMRSHYFNEIVPPWLDVEYLLYVAGFLFGTGLLLMRMTRRQASAL